MQQMFKDFVKQLEADGKAVFVKPLDFYLDTLRQFDYKKILAALAEEIKAQKREMEEMAKTGMGWIQNF